VLTVVRPECRQNVENVECPGDGYYLVLAPLSAGTHTIHWMASMELIPFWNPWDAAPVPPYPGVFQEVTYLVTVVPRK
jgi:hypothetical protein